MYSQSLPINSCHLVPLDDSNQARLEESNQQLWELLSYGE